MNAEQILKTIFPQATEYRTHLMQGHCNGLPSGSKPQNCVIVDQFDDKNFSDRRTHYILDIDAQMVHIRVCSASAGCGYSEYAAILHCTTNADTDTIERFHRIKESWSREK